MAYAIKMLMKLQNQSITVEIKVFARKQKLFSNKNLLRF